MCLPETRGGAIRDVLALLILKHRMPASALDPETLRLLGEFSAAAGLLDAAPADAQGKLDDYFEQHPPSAELLARFTRVLTR